MTTTTAITLRTPPAPMRRAFNRVTRTLLTTRMHGTVDGALLLLHITGRRTGHHYDIPIRHHDIDGRLTIFTAGPWRANLRSGADIEITHHGRRQPVHADLTEDPAAVAAVYREVIEHLGWKSAQRALSITIHLGRTPTLAEVEDAARAAHGPQRRR